ncbi:AbfB domain-containing protein [Actinoplanes sp. NPDC026623]|uniref:AbfB domain-containing protein n=1 Tax=Actinoplanes sp. NPDC026623 TaxID=3155610 RepID=UPI0033FA6FEF
MRDRPLAVAAWSVGSAVFAVTLAVGITVAVAGWSHASPAGPPALAAPSAAGAGLLPTGTVSLESADAAGRFVTITGEFGTLATAGTDDEAATFEVVAGLSNPECFSLRTPDGRYLRHSSWRLRSSPDEGTVLFRGDATFCPREGSAAGSVVLESQNYPGWFLRHVGDDLWVDRSDGTAGFRADSTFHVRSPLAGK